MVDRYGCFVGTNDYQKMAAADDGAWVKYADYEALEAEVARMRKALEELIQAMNDYEMEVDEPAPYKHKEMMKRAKAALEASDGADNT